MAGNPVVQQGVITLANGASSITVDRGTDPGFDTTVTKAQTMLRFSVRTAGTSAAPNLDYGVTGWLEDSGDVITFERGGTTDDVIIEWSLSDIDDGFVCQYVSISLGSGVTTNTAAINAASVGGGRWLVHLGARANATATTPARVACQIKIDSSTQVSATRNTGTGTTVVNMVVVEHDSATVTTEEFTLTTTTNTTEDRTVAAHTIASTMLFASGRTTDTGGQPVASWQYALSSTTNLRFTRALGTSATFVITAYLVAMSDGTVVNPQAPTHADGVGTVNTTITAVTLARTFAQTNSTYQPSFGGVNNNAFARSLVSAALTSTTNLRTVKGNVNTAAAPQVQVIEWAEGGASAAITGTLATGTKTQADVKAGGQTIIITLTGDTFVAAGATFDAQRQAIIDGLDAASSPSTGWNTLVRDTLAVTTVVRTSGTVVTITLPAVPLYAITADEVITCTIPAAALTLAAEVVATPTITIHEGAVLSAYSGTTNGSGVLTTSLTSDQASVRVLTRAYIGATEVGRTTTRPT